MQRQIKHLARRFKTIEKSTKVHWVSVCVHAIAALLCIETNFSL